MANNDPSTDRARMQEDEYFRRRDRELIERMRQATADQQEREQLGRSTGLSDPDLLRELQALGFTPDTVGLLPLMPVLQVAWAEGGVTADERTQIVKLARARGIGEGSLADLQLSDWMTHQPAEQVFAGANRLIRAMLEAGSEQVADLNASDLVTYCEQIAKASGGFLGFNKVSDEERVLLALIASELQGRKT